MNVFSYENLSHLPKGAVVLLGDFDGVHLGHQELVRAALSLRDKPHAVLLFDKDPAFFLANGKSKRILTTLEDKIAIFDSLKIEIAYVIHVDSSFFALSPDEFIEKYLLPILPTALVCGTDFRFGNMAKGDTAKLAEYLPVFAINLLERNGKKVASRDIKAMIAEGKVEEAKEEMGRPFALKGIVHEGFHNGRTIGFPTLNVHLEEPYVLPGTGVYQTETVVDGVSYPSITNVGSNPTVGLIHHDRVESYLKGYEGNAYEKTVTVRFLKKIREEKKFDSLEDLKKQLEQDKRCLD